MSGPVQHQAAHLHTARLVLRRWRDADRVPFAELNADPAVMEHFPAVLSPAESDAFVDRVEAHFERHGWGLWAVERTADRGFLGYVGLWPATFESHFTPAVEVGWRLAHEHWGQGFAGEAAGAAVADGFDRFGFDEIVSFTAAGNLRSRRVMEKLGMRRDPSDDFEHPGVGEDNPLRQHVLFRLTREVWMRSGGQ